MTVISYLSPSGEVAADTNLKDAIKQKKVL